MYSLCVCVYLSGGRVEVPLRRQNGFPLPLALWRKRGYSRNFYHQSAGKFNGHLSSSLVFNLFSSAALPIALLFRHFCAISRQFSPCFIWISILFSFLFFESAVCKPYFWGYCCGCHLSHPVPGVKCTEAIFRTSAQIIESCRTRAVSRRRDRIFILCALFLGQRQSKETKQSKKGQLHHLFELFSSSFLCSCC